MRAGQKLETLRKVAHKLTREERVTVYCVMEYASLCWMSASWSFLTPSKAHQVIGVNDQQARPDLNIPPLLHRRLVATASILYKMQTKVNVQLLWRLLSLNPTCSDFQLDPWGEFHPWGRNECVTNEPQRTSAGRLVFILETSYPSRRIIRQTDNSSKYKSEDEFCSIICLETTAGKKTLRTGNIAKI